MSNFVNNLLNIIFFLLSFEQTIILLYLICYTMTKGVSYLKSHPQHQPTTRCHWKTSLLNNVFQQN